MKANEKDWGNRFFPFFVKWTGVAMVGVGIVEGLLGSGAEKTPSSNPSPLESGWENLEEFQLEAVPEFPAATQIPADGSQPIPEIKIPHSFDEWLDDMGVPRLDEGARVLDGQP